jgi:hypothetical protein
VEHRTAKAFCPALHNSIKKRLVSPFIEERSSDDAVGTQSADQVRHNDYKENAMTKQLFLMTLAVAAGTFIGCADPVEDPTVGVHEHPLVGDNGTVSCTSPKKVLICHIPPGNPANAHSICVGAPAEDAHVRNHGDSVGACASEPPAPEPEDAGSAPEDAGTIDEGGGGTGDADAGIPDIN